VLTRREREHLRFAVDRATRAKLASREADPRRTKAERFLLDALSGGPRPVVQVRQEAALLGIGRDALNRAKRRLGVGYAYDRAVKAWTWRIAPREEAVRG
jgi:hypothetical protein